MKTRSILDTGILGRASRGFFTFLWVWCAIASQAADQYAGVAGDLSKDGLSDVVLMDQNGTGQILINQGNGQLIKSKSLFSRSDQIGPLSITDLSGDGYPEILLSYPYEAALEAVWGDAYDQGFSYLLKGLGTETTSLAVGHESTPQVAMGFAGSNLISIIGYQPNNTILQEYNIQPAYIVYDLLFSDLTGDSVEELVVLAPSGDGNLVQAHQNQGGAWVATPLANITGTSHRRMQIGSLNGDALPDFLLWSTNAEATALLSSPNGGFDTQPITLENSYQKEVADLNQDGLLDVIVVSPKQDAVKVWLNQGNLQFTSLAVPNLTGLIKDVITGNFTSPNTIEFYIWTEEVLGNIPQDESIPAQDAAGKQQLSLFQIQNGNVVPLTQVALEDSDLVDGIFHNVVVYKKTDMASGIFYPYSSYFIPDWTTSASPITAGQTTVQREVLQNNILTPDTPVTLSGLDFLTNPADYEAHTNQYSPDISEFAFGKPVLPRSLRIETNLPSGTYQSTITVKPSSEPGAAINYRFNGGSWQTYTPDSTQIILYKSTDVDFSATKDGVSSPVLSRSYQIDQEPSADSDQDDIPDALEDALGLPIYSTSPDYDNDNWNDLDELVRSSDPKDPGSVPMDSDGDRWSDWDESVRGTDPNDPASKPVALGLSAGEHNLTLTSSIRTTEENTGDPIGQNSILSVWSLANHEVTSATYEASAWNLRLPGSEPLFYHVREQNPNTVTLVGYSPAYIPCWTPPSLYDGSQTVDQWLELIRQSTNQYLISRTESISTSSMAATLALQYFLIRETGGNTVIRFGDGEIGRTPEAMNEVQSRYDFDSTYRHLQSNLPEGHSWTGLVNQVIEWSRNNPPTQDVDITLQQLLLGQAVPAGTLPPALTPEMISQAVADVSAVLGNVPKRTVELTGTIQWEKGNAVLVTAGGERWPLNLLSDGAVTGSQVTIKGILDSECSNKPDLTVRVLEIMSDQPKVVFNNNDTDGDGLADQWEAFYFAHSNALPNEDSDGDGFNNSAEYTAYTHPRDGNSNPSTVPTPTPTTTATSTPVIAVTPTPTVTPSPGQNMLNKPVAIKIYTFSEASLGAAGFTEIPGGFINNPAGTSTLGPVPTAVGVPMSDGQGLVLECDPGEVQLVLAQPVITVGQDPVLVRCSARATIGSGQFAFAALDGSLDGSIGTLIPSDTQHMVDQMKQLAFVYYPTITDTMAIVLQLFTPPSSPETVTVYIDNVEIIPLVPGTAIEPDDVTVRNGDSKPGPLPLLSKPQAVWVYDCAGSSVESNGFTQIHGGFLPGAIPGSCTISDVPFGWTDSSSDGKGLLFTCEPGQTQLILASPAITAGNGPILIRAHARASTGEGNFALVTLDGVLDGSIATFIPSNTSNWLNGLYKTSLLYQPTKSETVVVGAQLYVPPTASGPVSVFIDEIEIIPFVEGSILEAADFAK